MENHTDEVLEDALSLKEKGNQFVKDGNFKAAVLLYTQAIKIEPSNPTLYSNRSLAYLRLMHHFLALQDAIETITLQPQWAKGYFRKAEVEAAVGLTVEAALSYTRALQLQPQDVSIINAIKKVTLERKRKREVEEKLPWLCCCVGVIIGIVLVILDYTLVEHVTTRNPMIQVAVILGIAGVAWGIGKQYLILEDRNIGKSLRPPHYEDEGAGKQRWLVAFLFGLALVFVDITVIEIIGLKENPAKIIVFASAVVGGGFGICSLLQFLKFYKDNSNEEPNQVDEKLPLLCGCVGAGLGMSLAILDYILSEPFTPQSPVVKAVIITAGAICCWCVGKSYNMLEHPNSAKAPDTDRSEDKLPQNLWIGGLILGVIFVITDITAVDIIGLREKPVRLISFALALAGGGYGLGRLLQYLKSQESETSEALKEDPTIEENHVPERTSNKYTKAQARYRYKKGKM